MGESANLFFLLSLLVLLATVADGTLMMMVQAIITVVRALLADADAAVDDTPTAPSHRLQAPAELQASMEGESLNQSKSSLSWNASSVRGTGVPETPVSFDEADEPVS